MSAKFWNRLIPAFVPLAFELFRQFKRNGNHNKDIKKFDKTQEKLSTIEHLMVRLEKKVLSNRDDFKRMSLNLQIWLVINTALLIAIFIKLFFL